MGKTDSELVENTQNTAQSTGLIDKISDKRDSGASHITRSNSKTTDCASTKTFGDLRNISTNRQHTFKKTKVQLEKI